MNPVLLKIALCRNRKINKKKIVLDDSSPEKSIKNTKGKFVDVDESSSSEDHDGESSN